MAFPEFQLDPLHLNKNVGSAEKFENSWGFYRRHDAAADRRPLHRERTTSASAFATGLNRHFAPEAKTNTFFKIFGGTPNYIFKIYGIPLPKSQKIQTSLRERGLSL